MSENAPDAELEKTKCFVDDATSNTLARDHQSRGMYFEGEHERTYVAYMDDDFYARITYYDHDDENWVHPVLVDDCIGPDRLKDGHNVPNLFVTDDGTIHLLYGSHGHVFKHAYSESREQIEEWKTGMRLGEHGTYPYFARIDDGQYLLFYRYGPEGGYNNPFLAVHESTDHGRTWSERSKLVSWPTGCKISQVVYDPVKDLVHLMLWMPGSEKTADLSPYLTDEWRIFHCRYDPRSETVSAIDGSELGPLATEEDFVTNQAVVSYEQFGAFVLHNGDPYFVLCDGDGRIYFGFWNGQELKKRFLPEESVADLSRSNPVVYTEDGNSFRVYGLTEPESEEYHGGSLVCLMTLDRGERWEGPERIVDHRKLGHGLASINEVMNYSGEGPFLLVNEPTGSFPQDWRKNKYTHYDNPSRRDKKIYTVDFDGEFVERKFGPGYFREDPYDGWSRQFQ